MRARGALGALILVSSLGLSGCATHMGSRSLPGVRFNYNEAIVRSWNEQMLLNLVRLRYRDTPLFLDVNTVVSSYSWSGAASISPSIREASPDSYGLSSGVGYSESPTVTYTPLDGKEFVRRMMSPIEPETLLLLSQSGWSIERLLRCCVHQVNGLTNAPSAAGPTPVAAPQYREFHRLAQLLRKLQVAGLFELELESAASADAAGDSNRRGVFLVPLSTVDVDDELRQAAQEIREILARAAAPGTLDLSPGGRMVLRGRSLLAAMFYLSHAVDTPGDHRSNGIVTVTRNTDGSEFDWHQMLDGIFHIRAGSEPMPDSFVQVSYRGHWYSIADHDLTSKTTFGLLTYLFSLQSTETTDNLVLTVAAGQ